MESILWVDDDPDLLFLVERLLRGKFDFAFANDGASALRVLGRGEPFAAIVADISMPGMSGIELLQRAKAVAPDTVRVVVTGEADQGVAIDAINSGAIFRFLTKPIQRLVMQGALDDAAAQYHLVVAEHELLRGTLTASVQVLIDILALSHPQAFGRTNRVRQLSRQVTERLNLANAWQAELAAMLSQIGCITVAPDAFDRILSGGTVTTEELATYDAHPRVGANLLAKIPRLRSVSEAIALQGTRFDLLPKHWEVEADLLTVASILKVCLDYDALLATGLSAESALRRMSGRPGWYDPVVLQGLVESETTTAEPQVAHVAVDQLVVGMTLAEDMVSESGMVIMVAGQQVTPALALRLKNLSNSIEAGRSFRVHRAAA